ncbi:hypothetical protein CS063_09175 [Sporanaerobium hydrogeniformans]|uniref:Uncharacterized protein n=1 Tax=Sporanaerobium hydrogeniformans TaxID=3072179 RepID=A0AC61DCH2_9FIRM|nr:hypothetical protein CS063_09175 [Sporanaerobium hydrogeniformans]
MRTGRKKRILILYGDSGYGGYNIAQAIKESIEKENTSKVKIYLVNPIMMSDKIYHIYIRCK